MAFSDFSLEMAARRLGLTLSTRADLFSGVNALEVPPILRTLLDRWAPQALEVNTEKARSELIIAPILMEAAYLTNGRLGVYSGVSLDVDRDRGLFGRCDFLVGRKAEPFLLGSPLLAVVEAKNEDIPGGLGPCIAEMVAARVLNERKTGSAPVIHGAVTTGSEWLFLQLDGDTVTFDSRDPYARRCGKDPRLSVSDRGRTYSSARSLIRALNSLNLGCSAPPIHSKRAASVVEMTAPACSRRRRANSRSMANLDPTASAGTCTR